MDWLYTGITGRFQQDGHQVIGQWVAAANPQVVLEIGCGHGHHLEYSNHKYSNYIGLDIEYKYVHTLRQRHNGQGVINGNAYSLPFRDNSVDSVLSIYNFEHLRDLSLCLLEIHRVLKPNGTLLVGLPAEGGLLYGLGRQLTSKPYMERKYQIDYDAIVQWEHWNTYQEVVVMIREQFRVEKRSFIPFVFLPTVHANIIVCLQAIPFE